MVFGEMDMGCAPLIKILSGGTCVRGRSVHGYGPVKKLCVVGFALISAVQASILHDVSLHLVFVQRQAC